MHCIFYLDVWKLKAPYPTNCLHCDHCLTFTSRTFKNRAKQKKTGVIYDPLGQAHIVFTLFCIARFWKVGTNGRYVRKQFPTGNDCGLAEWINIHCRPGCGLANWIIDGYSYKFVMNWDVQHNPKLMEWYAMIRKHSIMTYIYLLYYLGTTQKLVG